MWKLVSIAISMFLVVACNSNPDSGDIKLNNGQKWEVNSEMKPHIEQGGKILNDYISAQSNDYQALAEGLKNQNSNLIKSCTMKGESHDELHKWLHPHMELIESLSNADDAQKAEAIIAQIEQSFKSYETYFE